MDFLKRHLSTLILITIGAIWIGISLGTNECPSCVVVDIASNSIKSEPPLSPATAVAPALAEPAWTAVDLDGNLITSNDLSGKVGVLVYWATWCGGCKKEIPDLVALRREFADSELEIIGLSVDKPHKDLKAYAAAAGINYRVARVTPSIVETFGQAESIPTLIIIDQEGRVQFRHSGFMEKEALSERVRSLLATRRIDRAFGS